MYIIILYIHVYIGYFASVTIIIFNATSLSRSIKVMEIPFVTHPSQRYVKNSPADSSARLP